MLNQTCFKCNENKSLKEFYSHPQMSNGYLGKCKECTKKDTRINSRTPKSRIREKERNKSEKRLKHLSETSKNWRKNNPEKYKAHNKLNNALRDGKIRKGIGCEECKNKDSVLHAHHEDYSKPLDVIWLCPICHGKKNPSYIGTE